MNADAELKLPSRFQIGDTVLVDRETVVVCGIWFQPDKVFYNVLGAAGPARTVDSCDVEAPKAGDAE